MQHLALNVDTEEELLSMRDRLRSHGHWVMGPLDHGFCKSIYFAGPEGLMLEFSTSEGGAIDQEAWIDPEVVGLNGISQEELERYKHPQPFASRGGTVQNPAVDPDNPPMRFPPGQDAVYRMSDEDVTAKLSGDDPARSAKGGLAHNRRSPRSLRLLPRLPRLVAVPAKRGRP